MNIIPIYNKLIRDRILEILESIRLTYNAYTLLPDQYLTEIKKKLYEEVKEFDETTNEMDAIEEMADVLELLHAALKVYGKSFDELEAVRIKKKDERGGFDKGLYLIDVQDK
ncbi:phosphoribosyl-ATP pyrophosphohydrolase [Lysinibacillus sp. 2017]|uniref:phosphoribosyl-ATP pyrophosphohydrolase n=1 Tax=unclassified Lysinibacillus TaxID=2636778 RepID=UPI0035160B99